MKVCSKCGEEKDEYQFSQSGCGKRRADCKKCDSIARKIRGRLPQAKEQSKAWRERNKDKERERNRVRSKQRDKKRGKTRDKQKRQTLTNSVVKVMLKKQGFPPESINQEIIDIKRLLIKNKRKWLTKK